VILIGRVGALCGNVHLVQQNLWASEHAFRVFPKKVFDLTFMAHLLRVLDLNRFAIRTAQPLINTTIVESQVGVLPTLQEQRSIAAFLDRETGKIDALVAKKKRLIELLQEKRTALITRAVTKGLDPDVPMKDSGVEWLGEIPATWKVKRIKNLSRFVTSGSRGWAEYYAEEGPLFLRIGNLRSGSIELNLNDLQHVCPPEGAEGARTRVHPGDLLISITALIGAVAVVPQGLPDAFVNQHLALVRLSDTSVEPRWLAYCVLSRVGQEQFSVELYGGTKDGLGLEDIRSLVVLLPPMTEQRRIVELLDTEDANTESLIRKIREGIEKLKEFRTALISAVVTGKIDVQDSVAEGDQKNAPSRGLVQPNE
jgi:type I restriction enzyme S subunit